MVNKMRSLVVNFPRSNAGIICAVLALISVFTISVFGQGRNYTVGPGDVLYIAVWGDESMSGQVTVGPDGTIMLPQPIGSVYVSQMTADEITELLTEKIGEYIRLPVVSVSIREFQGFVVHVLGQVIVPSFYQVPDGTTLQEAITQASGFTDLADISAIILYRKKDEQVEELKVDFSRFLKQNDMESNPVLGIDDIIVVPGISMNERISNVVTVLGEAVEPGPYELDTPMSLLDILALAGGASRNADLRNIVIYDRSVEGKEAYRQANIDVTSPEARDLDTPIPTVYPGEIVIIPSIGVLEEHTFSVNVAGQVVKPGSYPVVEGMRLMDAIFLAGGFAAEASIDNIVFIHEGQNGSTTSLLSLRDYLTEGNMDVNPVLHERDTIVVSTIETARSVSPVQMAFSPSVSVSVIGEVTEPGVYQMPAGSNLLGAIAEAGGPTNNADLKRTMIVRSGQSETEQRLLVDLEEVMFEGKLELLPDLSSGDIILVPKEREKRDWWGIFIGGMRDVTVVFTLVWYFIRIS